MHNLTLWKSLLQPLTKMMVMVKAYGYGVGPIGLSQFLEKNKVDYLGVANILEGVEIRKSGVKTPIMIMKPELDSFDLVVKHHLNPTIFSFHALYKLIDFVGDNPIAISIKINTGMNRLGFQANEIENLIVELKKHPNIKIESVFSHLAASDEPDYDAFTQTQIDLFENLSSKITTQFNYLIIRHLLNSNGIARFPKAQFEMVRLGIGLFGFVEDKPIENKLKNVLTLKSKIAQLHVVSKYESIGYGRKAIATKELKIATIPLGYADGFNRKFSNGNWEASIYNKKTATIGNICMDMAMFDVTDIACTESDYITIINSVADIKKMANLLNTIPYEILTSISPRVKRVLV